MLSKVFLLSNSSHKEEEEAFRKCFNSFDIDRDRRGKYAELAASIGRVKVNKYKIYTGGVRDNKDLTIGSSDIPILMKEADSVIKKTPHRLWLEKTGKEPDNFTGNYSTWLGHKMEPVIVAQHIIRQAFDYANDDTLSDETISKIKAFGIDIADGYYMDFVKRSKKRSSRASKTSFYTSYTEARHPDYPWALAHADALAQPLGKTGYLIEAKHGASWTRLRSSINPGGFDKNIEGPDGVPYHVQIQTQWQMFCYGIDLACVCMIVNAEYMEWWIHADLKLQAILLERAAHFIGLCEKGIAPDPTSYEDVKYIYPEINDSAMVLAAGEKLSVARKLHERDNILKAQMSKAKKEREKIKVAVGAMIGENKALKDGEKNKTLFSQSFDKNGKRGQRSTGLEK